MHKHKHKYNTRQSGFTIIELMIALTIGAILLVLGVPSFLDVIKSNRLTAQTNSLLTALHLARNEAITRGHDIRVLSISGNTDWASGWEIRLDVDGDGAIDAGIDTVVRNFDAIEKATLVGAADNVTYQSTGFVAAVNTMTLTADQCTSAHEYIRVVSVGLSGLLSSEKQTCP